MQVCQEVFKALRLGGKKGDRIEGVKRTKNIKETSGGGFKKKKKWEKGNITDFK